MKKLIIGLACMASTLSSQAAVQTFDWTLTGFDRSYWRDNSPTMDPPTWEPTTVLKGHFEVEDLNNDGTYSRSEVSKFVVASESLTECPSYEQCTLAAFSYTPGGALTFDYDGSGEWGSWGSGWQRYSNGYYFGADVKSSYYAYVNENDWSGASVTTHSATAASRFFITSAVPEPQTWLMLGAGIALLGAAKRRPAQHRASR